MPINSEKNNDIESLNNSVKINEIQVETTTSKLNVLFWAMYD